MIVASCLQANLAKFQAQSTELSAKLAHEQEKNRTYDARSKEAEKKATTVEKEYQVGVWVTSLGGVGRHMGACVPVQLVRGNKQAQGSTDTSKKPASYAGTSSHWKAVEA